MRKKIYNRKDLGKVTTYSNKAVPQYLEASQVKRSATAKELKCQPN